MTQYKVYRVENYLRVVNNTTGEIFSSPIKNVEVEPNNTGRPIYKIHNLKDWDLENKLNIAQILNESGTPYTQGEWETFYTENTSNFNKVGVEEYLTNAQLRASPVPVSGTLTDSQLRLTPVPISPRPNTTGSNGTTPYKLISLATTNASIVKSSGGNLYSIVAIGLTSTVRYLKLYNKATAPTVGTDVPVMTIPIPANTQGAGISIPFSMGVNFPLGISLAITGTAADNGTTAIGAGDVIINLTYA